MLGILTREQMRQRKRRRVLWATILLVGFAGFVAVSQWRVPLAQLYRGHRQSRSLEHAKAFAEKHDLPNALLALQVAVQANPQNPNAWRVAADTLEAAGLSQAVKVRQQVLAANPRSLADQLALAGTALRFQDLPAADAALDAVAASDRGTSAYLKLRAALALARKDDAVAESALSELLSLEPDNDAMRFNRAVIRLRHSNRTVAESARADLQNMAERRSVFASGALRELTREAAARGSLSEALDHSASLVALRDSTYEDRLLRLNVLSAAGRPDAASAEKELANLAANDAARAPSFATRLIVQGRAAEAKAWLGTLSEKTKSDPAVRAVTADCAAALGEWDGLHAALISGAWGQVAPEPLRLAFAAQAVAARERTDLVREVWREALQAAGDDRNTYRVLLRLAFLWKWQPEANETLLAVAVRFPDQVWAFNTLVSTAYAHKDIDLLRDAYTRWHRADPDNRRVAGDWAMLSLMADPTSSETEPKRIARELYEADPTNPFFATACAFALYQKGNVSEALRVMDQLAPADLAVPGRALYHGLILARAGKRERAIEALRRAEKADLLPPERELLNGAYALLRVSPPVR